ncbi:MULTISPECIES: hypothetical protein [unclassified Brachybacterium]|uniref:type II toxin-antitoxin system VapB family antitoxin n=1 Tax=unclassified Brachybacterium TaxID=2623841 RepID=UPI000C7FE1B2|nr:MULTISPECIES: hypothetical protein [unclassified Brachybacterium]PMC75996.1 hypothetical protein CJ197_04850 [Brachybacterium sp. UMB0905]
MTDVLIRGLSTEAVARIDHAAAAQGLSRNEYLRRHFESTPARADVVRVTAADWQRSAEVFADLADEAVMEDAWR